MSKKKEKAVSDEKLVERGGKLVEQLFSNTSYYRSHRFTPQRDTITLFYKVPRLSSLETLQSTDMPVSIQVDAYAEEGLILTITFPVSFLESVEGNDVEGISELFTEGGE